MRLQIIELRGDKTKTQTQGHLTPTLGPLKTISLIFSLVYFQEEV